MVHIVKKVMIVAIVMAIGFVNAQEFQGKAYYKTKREVSFQLDSTSVTSDQQRIINQALKSQFEKEYVLDFNKTESVYKELESLGDASQGSAGAQLNIVGFGLGGGNDILYKNTKTASYTHQRESFSKQFLIRDSLTRTDWKLENETKQIGNYLCYKATFTREVERRVFSSFNVDDKEGEEKTEKLTIVTTAWYTPEIPVSHGPSTHWGLPGLILEVNDGGTVMICNKIVINPKDKAVIKKPTKGKKVSREEFIKISEKKNEELSRIYGGGIKKGGSNIKIRIGG